MKRGEHRVKEVSDFLKIAYKYNKVRDIKEAFEEFPIEEEWHKGKIENVLREEAVTYGVEYEIVEDGVAHPAKWVLSTIYKELDKQNGGVADGEHFQKAEELT